MAALHELDRSAVILEADQHPVELEPSKYLAIGVFRGKASRIIQPGEQVLAQPGNFTPTLATVLKVEQRIDLGTAIVTVSIELPKPRRLS